MVIIENRPPRPQTSFRQKIILMLFGLILFFVMLEIGLRLGAFMLASLQEYRNMHAIRQNGTVRIMSLGESMAVVGGSTAYPFQLEDILNKRNIAIKFSVINKGIGGTNTSSILETLEENINKYKPEIVVAMIGINDSGHHMPFEKVVPKKRLHFIKSLRLYKLARLLWLHIVTKMKEIGVFISKETNAFANPDIKEEAILTAKENSVSSDTNIEPKTSKEYSELAKSQKVTAEYGKAEEYFIKAIALDPNDDNAYVELGDVYRIRREFNKAEEFFKEAIRLNPKNDNAYMQLSRLSCQQEQYLKAEGYVCKAIALNPNNDNAYACLGLIYRARGEFNKAEGAFKKAIELNPSNDFAHNELGAMYEVFLKNDEAAEEVFNGMSHTNEERYGKLAWIYIKRGESAKAEELIEKILELKFNDEFTYGMLAVLYRELGKQELAEAYYNKANDLREKSYNAITRSNYLKIKEILDRHRIKLVCVQYPVRSIEPLKRIFEGQEGCIFVDNEKIFKDAVRHSGYKKYFIDLFAGDFGHCTPEGNRLLAGNIADAIMKEYFKK